MPKLNLKLIKATILCVLFSIILSTFSFGRYNQITAEAISNIPCKQNSLSSSECTQQTNSAIKSVSVSTSSESIISSNSKSSTIQSIKDKVTDLCFNENSSSTSSNINIKNINSQSNISSTSKSLFSSSVQKNNCKPCINTFSKEKNSKGLSVYSEIDFSDLRYFDEKCNYESFNLNTKNGYDSLNLFCRKRGLAGLTNVDLCNLIEFAPYIEKQKQPDVKAQENLRISTPQLNQKGISGYGQSTALTNIGKRLNVPYFNQFVDPSNNQTPGDWNKGGWYMCTAAATTGIAAYYNTFPYKGTNDELYKQYMYSDGSSIGNNAEFKDNRLNKVACPDKTQGTTKNWYGVYGYTGLESGDVNSSCRGGSFSTIIQGLDALGLDHNTILSQDGFWSAANQKSRLTIQQVKNSIDAGKSIIFSTQNHIFTIKGYTKDNKIIVNDSWNDGNTNKTSYPSLYKFGAGFDAVYDLANLYPVASDSGYQTHFYAIEVWREGFNPEAPKLTDPNITRVIPLQINYMKSLDFGCKTDDGSMVYISDRNGFDCQKMRYNSNMTITNGYGKCLDGGAINDPNNRWVRFSTCHNQANQQWMQEGHDTAGRGRIWSQAKTTAGETLCMEYFGLNNGDSITMKPCNTNLQNQKFWYDIGITGKVVPAVVSNITDPNISNVIPLQVDYNIALDEGCKTADGSPVYTYQRVGNDCQKMRYNTGNYTITNPFGKCMDAGDINNPSNRWLRYSTCHGGNNQKWFQANDGRIWSHQRDNANQVMCIEYTGTGNGNSVNVNPCNGNQSQKFYFDIGMTRQEVPSNIKYMMMRSLYNNYFGMNIYGGGSANQSQVKMYGLSGTDNELMTNNSNSELVFKNGKCLDAGDINNPNNRWLRIGNCHGGYNQKWYFSDNRIVSFANQGMCVDSQYGDQSGSTLYMYPCHNGGNQKWTLR